MVLLLASLERLVIQLRKKKQEATNLRKKAKNNVKEFRSAERRSSLGLQSLDKKIQSEREEFSDVSKVLTMKNSQLESIGRLIAVAEDRLAKENEVIEQTKQEIEFAENPAEKQNAEARLRSLNDRANELVEEIKSRNKTAKKITGDVADFSDAQSKITSKIQKQTQSKPSLRETKAVSRKSVQKFLKELEKRTKSEENAQKALDKAHLKLKELLANRRKAAAKKKAAPKTRPAKKKAAPKTRPAKKKAAPKTRPAKKKAAPKTRPAKKKAAPKTRPAKKKAAPKTRPAKKKAAPKTRPAKKKAAAKKKSRR